MSLPRIFVPVRGQGSYDVPNAVEQLLFPASHSLQLGTYVQNGFSPAFMDYLPLLEQLDRLFAFPKKICDELTEILVLVQKLHFEFIPGNL